jgi:hypothetical protein
MTRFPAVLLRWCTVQTDAAPAVPSNASTTAGSVGFTASAVASIDNDATIDGWSVNDIKGGLTQRFLTT